MSDFKDLQSLPEISFIDNKTIDQVKSEMVADYESYMTGATGKPYSLPRAHERRMELYAAALQFYQGLQYIDRAGKMQLLKYAQGTYLDHLAAWKGVSRRDAAPARTTIRFTLSAKRTSATSIPKGTRVSTEGIVYFATEDYAEIPANTLYADVPAVALVAGESGNGLVAGELCRMVDPVAYVESVANLTETAGGADVESDASLAERAWLAPSAYSTAGPEDSYIYHVKSYSAAIGDVKVSSTQAAGQVDIVFLMKDGSLPSSDMISGLESYLGNRKIRPDCDLVTVAAPEEVGYTIDMTYYINRSDSARAVAIQAAVSAAVSDYVLWQRKIGRDINPSKLSELVMAAGAKRVTVTAPTYTTVSAVNVSKLASGASVTYGGLEDD